jgi:hypothetical protein
VLVLQAFRHRFTVPENCNVTPHFVAFFVPRVVVYASSQDVVETRHRFTVPESLMRDKMLLNGVAGPIDGYGVLMCRLVLGWTEGPSLVGLPLSSHKSKRDVVQCLITTPSDVSEATGRRVLPLRLHRERRVSARRGQAGRPEIPKPRASGLGRRNPEPESAPLPVADQ